MAIPSIPESLRSCRPGRTMCRGCEVIVRREKARLLRRPAHRSTRSRAAASRAPSMRTAGRATPIPSEKKSFSAVTALKQASAPWLSNEPWA